MFETQIESDNSYASFLVQQFVAIVGPAVLAFSGESLFLDSPPESLIKAGWSFVIWTIGLFLGLLVHRLFPRSGAAGRLVWVLPVFVFVMMFILESIQSSFEHAISAFFITHTNGEEDWLIVLMTYPTSQTLLYSAGMLIDERRRRRVNRVSVAS